ncbi:hypothetical protein INS49_010321 [Diaporthe citri]|uniref:uncharacterized protein n=1 Tax=Diaporthe citri TaxID=83186 RepID=UPI001C7F29BC|nr:uncharacterized protein INS49_010321 [Diaporthe citri]KAG6362092.1 hypothetical protein INS49_010321 [Diaporthe citri]
MSVMITALRGFRVRPETLDNYLAEKGDYKGSDIGTTPPQYPFDDRGAPSDKASNVLRKRLVAMRGDAKDSSGIFVVVPFVMSQTSSWVFVTYSYAFVHSQLLITTAILPEPVPRGFEELRQEVLEYTSGSNLGDDSEGLMGFYIVRTNLTGGQGGGLVK